mmetsp:Transcript_29415/g.68723  ORF Transcript_29415/g.68723 Transcript_29415/m.68723 type:complete len:251 (-) Transcript_29415:53-805(-)
MAAMSLDPWRGSAIPALQLVPTMLGDGQDVIKLLNVLGRPTCGEPSTSLLGPEKRLFSRLVTPDARLVAALAERCAACTETTRAMKPRNPSTMPATNSVRTSSVGRVWCSVCGDATSSTNPRSVSKPSILLPGLSPQPLPRARYSQAPVQHLTPLLSPAQAASSCAPAPQPCPCAPRACARARQWKREAASRTHRPPGTSVLLGDRTRAPPFAPPPISRRGLTRPPFSTQRTAATRESGPVCPRAPQGSR